MRVLSYVAVCLAIIGIPAHAGLTFNITYTDAVKMDANYANIQSAVNYVKNEYSTLYSDNVTLNFTIDESAINLGQSLFSNNFWRGNYTTLRAALAADAKSPYDAIATMAANLPAAAPYADACGLAPNCWYAPSAEAKALGLITDQTLFDGTYTFSNTVSYTYDPNNRAVASKYDFIGVTEHEFAELMGRTSQRTTFGYDILDTMRFTSVGTRQVNSAAGVYFSFDNGNSNLAGYNSGGGDRQDFDGSVKTDPYNASTNTGQAHSLNAVDTAEMDVIGWDLVTPEPKQVILLVFMIGILLLVKRRFCA